jgi:DNA-binding response OmpR family regulator
VLLADNGRSGLDLFLSERPDLVITDVMMPEMNGADVTRRIKEADASCPVIAVSGSETAWAAAQQFGPTGWGGAQAAAPLGQARREGADITIGKPFDVATLRDAVQKLLERRRAAASRSPAAAKRTNYHIRPDSRGRWTVERDGSTRAIMRASTQEDAVLIAQRLAGSARTSLIIGYDADGGVERRIAYGEDGS